jgi:putative colanic acid biosynthesis glycosyltransferase
MKFFSIITVCKNNLEELKTTFNSIHSQTNSDYDWIIVDADSADGTKEWLKDLDSVHWISEPDKGIYDGMNKGISMSRGKYMIFMNSGDCFASDDVLEKSKSWIEKSNFPVFVYGDSIDISEESKEYYRNAKSYKKNWMGMITQHQAMFFNRDKLGNIKYSYDFPLSADYAFISSVLKKSGHDDILYIDFPICKFSLGGINEMQRFQAIKEDYLIRKNIIELSWLVSYVLYLLHYFHTLIKKLSPSSRFIRHQSVTK